MQNQIARPLSLLSESFKYALSLRAFIMLMGSILVASLLAGIFVAIGIALAPKDWGDSPVPSILMNLLGYIAFILIFLSGIYGSFYIILQNILKRELPSYKTALLKGLATLPKMLLISLIAGLVFLAYYLIGLLVTMLGTIPFLGSILQIVIVPVVAISGIIVFLLIIFTFSQLAIPSFLMGNGIGKTLSLIGFTFTKTSFKNLLSTTLELYVFKIGIFFVSFFIIAPLAAIGIMQIGFLSLSTLMQTMNDPFGSMGSMAGLFPGMMVFFVLIFSIVYFMEFAGSALIFFGHQKRHEEIMATKSVVKNDTVSETSVTASESASKTE